MMDGIRTYPVQIPYSTLGDPPAINVVIGKSGTEIESSYPYEQQKLASQRPRGTRLDSTGTRIQVKGARNYTSRNLYISREEMFDDVVSRGLRADGLSTKLGVKNHKDGIGKLISELFEGDSRLPVIEQHFRTQRQKSNSAKTMFATMAHEELVFLKQETFPSRIDVQIRDYLLNAFAEHPEKLQSAVEVLKQIQHIFKAVTPHVDFLSNHNFQTRGFFLDIILMTCSFLMQIIQDYENDFLSSEGHQSNDVYDEQSTNEKKVSKENERAAEILLSVGSDIVDKSKQTTFTKAMPPKISKDVQPEKPLPTTIVVEGAGAEYKANDEWATVEMVDTSGTSRYVLIKSTNDEGTSMGTAKILNLLQSHGLTWDDKIAVSLNHSQIANVFQEKQPSQSDALLNDVLQDAGEDNMVANIDISKQTDDMPCNSVDANLVAGKDCVSGVNRNSSVIMTKAGPSNQSDCNDNDLLISIEPDFSESLINRKRPGSSAFVDDPKKLKISGMDPS